MSYQLEFTNEAIANLEKLTQVVQVRVVKKINWLVENFELITPQSLAADLSGFYKLRVGDYRVIYSLILLLFIKLDIEGKFISCRIRGFSCDS
jgi:mRNA interferase RelE/StbE